MKIFKKLLTLFILAMCCSLPLSYAFSGGDNNTDGEIVVRSTGVRISDTLNGTIVANYYESTGMWRGNNVSCAQWNKNDKTVFYAIRAELLSGSTYACESNHGTSVHFYQGYVQLMAQNPNYDSSKELSSSNPLYVPVTGIPTQSFCITQQGVAGQNPSYTNYSGTFDFSSVDLTQYKLVNQRDFTIGSAYFTAETGDNYGYVHANAAAEDVKVELALFARLTKLLGYTRESVQSTLDNYAVSTGYDDIADVALNNIWIKDPITVVPLSA